MLQSKSWILKGWKRVAIFFAALLLWLWDLCMRNNHKIRLMDTEDKRWMARSSHSRKKPEPETKTMAAIICVWHLWDKRKKFRKHAVNPEASFSYIGHCNFFKYSNQKKLSIKRSYRLQERVSNLKRWRPWMYSYAAYWSTIFLSLIQIWLLKLVYLIWASNISKNGTI